MVIKGKLIAEAAHVKRLKLDPYREYKGKLRELEQDYQNRSDPKICQQIKDIKAKINDILLDEIEKKNKFLKQSYYEAGSKATKLLAKRIRKQQAMNNIHKKNRDPHTNKVLSSPEEIEKKFQRYYQDHRTRISR